MLRVQNSAMSLAIVSAISAGAIGLAGAATSKALVAIFSALTVVFFAAAGARAFRERLKSDPTRADYFPALLQDLNGAYTFVFLWGAASLLILYTVSGLKWQHGWQYALGFLVFALAHRSFAWRLDKQTDPEKRSKIAETAYRGLKIEAFCIVAALAWILASGKLWTQKGDWAANDIFLAGGVSVLCLTFFVGLIFRRLNDR